MFIPLDERSRTIPIATRKISKDPEGEGLVTQWGTKDDIDFHDGTAGLTIHSLAHPFPVIWKAVKMFGENTNPIALRGTDPTHASAMLLAQMIYHQWLELAGGEKALNRQIGDDEGDEDDGDKAPSDEDEAPSDEDAGSSKQERDEFDPSGNDEDGSEAALTEDDEASHGDPSNTGPRRKAFDIPEDAPSLVSET